MSTQYSAAAGSSPTLYCIPPAGSGASYFAEWTRHKGADSFNVVGIQLPGRENRLTEPALRSMTDVVSEVVRLISQTTAPFVLLGHSMGGAVAFETAAALPARLRAQCRGVVISACSAPGEGLLRTAKSSATEADLISTLRRFGGTPESLLDNKPFMSMLTGILRADFEVCETAGTPADAIIDMALHVVGAADDPDVPLEELERWATRTSGDFSLTLVPDGGHHFVRRGDRVADMLKLVHSLI